MTKAQKIDSYRELCGVKKKEVKTLGNFMYSEGQLNRYLNGNTTITDEIEAEIYRAINKARAVKFSV